MANPAINTTFLFRRDTSQNWTSQNPILNIGEPGYETDTGKLKIGRANIRWNDLPYISGTASLQVDGALIYTIDTSKIELKGFTNAEDGMIPIKRNGELAWEQSTLSAEDIDEVIIQKLEEKLNLTDLITLKGNAYQVLGDNPITLYDANMQEIQGQVGDLYLYEDNQYLYTKNGWIALDEDAKLNNYVTQSQFTSVMDIINEGYQPPSLATNNSTGIVKGVAPTENIRNSISVEEDGSMRINSIGAEKILNIENGELVLNGGQAALN